MYIKRKEEAPKTDGYEKKQNSFLEQMVMSPSYFPLPFLPQPQKGTIQWMLPNMINLMTRAHGKEREN